MLSIALVVCLFALFGPAQAAAEEGPADRRSLSSPPSAGGSEGSDSLVLPPAPDAGADIGRTDWATADAATLRRESHLRRVTAAYGAAGTFAGMSVTCLLVATNQPDPRQRRGWHTGAAVLGGLSGAALVTGTVLWATTPPAPGSPRLAVGPASGLALTVTFY